MRTTRKLEAKLVKWHSWDHIILDGTQEMTRLRLSAFRRKGTAVSERLSLNLAGKKPSASLFVRSDSGVDAKAEKPSIFRDHYVVSYGNLELRLRHTSLI